MNPETLTKVAATHLTRTAYLYVRQSTLRQVVNNTESGKRQYALRQRAIALGWPADHVVVIDCDQGKSGASAADRAGFQQLVSEVGLGRAGIVLGLEVSRLARNNADWHRLLEICALSRTLICDEDGLYDPADFNDRLLLGLKGTMSEAELHVIRSRLRGGQLSKARRGELRTPLPVGFITDAADNIVLDPDAGVQQAIRLLFNKFTATKSARATVKAFAADEIRFPIRILKGHRKGELAWGPLTHTTVLRVLHNPRYAGAFSYGRNRTITQPNGKLRIETVPREDWIALVHDVHAGYITWDRYETNQKLLENNSRAHGKERNAGPPREGAALLQGIAICARCGRRLTIGYHDRRGTPVPDYKCMSNAIELGVKACQSISGGVIDAAIGDLLMETVTPLALEMAIKVQAELENRADEADQLRRSHLERVRHEVEFARRRYLAVDPDNRLVADTLEADWNNKLRDLQTAQDEYDNANPKHKPLTDDQAAQIRDLATDLPALWNNPKTPIKERKRMIRLLIEDVTLDRTDKITADIRFRGGTTTTLKIPLPPNAWQLRQTKPETLALLDTLLEDHTDSGVADELNKAGHRSGNNHTFTNTIVLHLRRSHGLPSHEERLKTRGLLSKDELAAALDVHASTIKAWNRAGLLKSKKANDKNVRLYERSNLDNPELKKRQGRRLDRRVRAAT